MNWKNDLNKLLLETKDKAQSIQTTEELEQEQARLFFLVVEEAFEEIKVEIEKHNRRVMIHIGKAVDAVDIYNGPVLEFTYAVKINRYALTTRGGLMFCKANRYDPLDSVQRYNFSKIHTIDKERVISDFMRAYEARLRQNVRQAK